MTQIVKNIILKSVDSLTPLVNNPRKHSKEQIALLAKSIEQYGFVNPILIDKNGVVIAGHGRLDAAKKLGIKDVPTIELGHLTEAQRKAFVLADNRLHDLSTWDEEAVQSILEELEEFDFDKELTFFDLESIEFEEPEERDGEGDRPLFALSKDEYENQDVKKIFLFFPNEKAEEILDKVKFLCDKLEQDSISELVELLIDEKYNSLQTED